MPNLIGFPLPAKCTFWGDLKYCLLFGNTDKSVFSHSLVSKRLILGFYLYSGAFYCKQWWKKSLCLHFFFPCTPGAHFYQPVLFLLLLFRSVRCSIQFELSYFLVFQHFPHIFYLLYKFVGIWLVVFRNILDGVLRMSRFWVLIPPSVCWLHI